MGSGVLDAVWPTATNSIKWAALVTQNWLAWKEYHSAIILLNQISLLNSSYYTKLNVEIKLLQYSG